MRLLMTVLTTCCFALSLPGASADEPVKKAAVRELDLKERKLKQSGAVEKPVVITNIRELSTHSGICFKEGLLYQLANQVDFDKEQLLLFAWSGSGQDKLTIQNENCSKRGKRVTFQYQRGLTDDVQPHYRLIVLPKTTPWSVAVATTKPE